MVIIQLCTSNSNGGGGILKDSIDYGSARSDPPTIYAEPLAYFGYGGMEPGESLEYTLGVVAGNGMPLMLLCPISDWGLKQTERRTIR